MSDTPRTDTALWNAKENNNDDGEIDWCHVALDMISHARELERELYAQLLENGKGSEREAALLGKVSRLERENASLVAAGDGLHRALECARGHGLHLERIINATLAELPVGNIKTHTPESIPERVTHLVREHAQLDSELFGLTTCNAIGAERLRHELEEKRKLEEQIAALIAAGDDMEKMLALAPSASVKDWPTDAEIMDACATWDAAKANTQPEPRT